MEGKILKRFIAFFIFSIFSFVHPTFSEILLKPKERPEIIRVTLEVMAMCGPSKGTAFFFKDALFNPDGGSWMEDGMSNGQVTLVKDGDSYDILFGDAARGSGYKQDGAQVFMLHSGEKFIRVGAFAGNYADIYNFDREDNKLVWSSNKSGPFSGKVAVYESDCTFIN